MLHRLRSRFSQGGAASAALSAPFLSTVAISFLFILGVSIVVPLLPTIISEYGVSRAGAGMLLSSFALGRLLFDVVAGVLGDRYGLRRVAVVACVVTLVASLAAATTPEYRWLLAARFVQGVGSALYMTAAMRHVMDLAPQGHVGRLLSIYQGVILAGITAGPIAGGFVAQVGGIAGPFLLYAVFALLGLVVALLVLPRRAAAPAIPATGVVTTATGAPGAGGESQSRLIRRLLADPTFLLILLATFTIFWSRSGVGSTMLPLVAAERFGFSEVRIGLLLTAVVAGNLLVILHAGRSVDRSGRRSLIIRSFTVTAPVVALFALITVPWALFLAAGVVGALKGYASVVPGVVLSDLAPARIRGTAVGIQRTMTDLGTLVGPVSAGALMDHLGFERAFIIAAAFTAAVAFAMTFMRETGEAPARAALHDRLRPFRLFGFLGRHR